MRCQRYALLRACRAKRQASGSTGKSASSATEPAVRPASNPKAVVWKSARQNPCVHATAPGMPCVFWPTQRWIWRHAPRSSASRGRSPAVQRDAHGWDAPRRQHNAKRHTGRNFANRPISRGLARGRYIPTERTHPGDNPKKENHHLPVFLAQLAGRQKQAGGKRIASHQRRVFHIGLCH